MVALQGYKELAACIIRQACLDLEDEKQQADAYHFLYSGWGQSLISFVSKGRNIQELDNQISSIIRCAHLKAYHVSAYARGHNPREVANYFNVSEEDIIDYCKRHCIHFMEV